MNWLDTSIRRGVRQRCASHEPPKALSLLSRESTDLLAAWVRKDNLTRGRDALLKDAGSSNIERAEELSDWLLREGWISRKEKLQGGSWQWESLTWRDLDSLKSLLGVGSRSTREDAKLQVMEQARTWLRDSGERIDINLRGAIELAVSQLGSDGALKIEVLATRLGLLESLATWHNEQMRGTRRDFALHAGDHTKSLGAGDWKWLERHFDLEDIGITKFIPVIWLAGDATLVWEQGVVDLLPVRCISIPLEDLLRATAIERSPDHWWLIENWTSFERQSQAIPPGTLLAWLPGRPSGDWLGTIRHLLSLAPVPLKVSADADPSGVDIACTVGQLWREKGLSWAPHRMGLAELGETTQNWALNPYDFSLIQRLLLKADLPVELKELCQAMLAKGRKAEQEGWL
ncbi:hypothetical protein C5F53_17945 [Rhodoferax sp. TS-BS-61-7]|nr:hypothetical protein C5F53_17945 [Rhodoferax sp. TS-BS-61-7]